MWIESRVTSWPLMFRRQFAQPIDVDSVFETLAEMSAYLSNTLRHIGQIATCQETEGIIYVMNNNMDAWVTVVGGGGTLVFLTLSELNTYLTNGDRVAGGIATCNETEGIIYILNNLRDAWITIDINSKLDSSDFYSHTGDTTIHFTKSEINISDINSAHTHSISDVSGLQNDLNTKTDISLFDSHTGETNPHLTNFIDLINTGHTTHIISDIINLETSLNNKTNLSSFNSHVGDSAIHFTKSSINISDINSAHTHNISSVTDLQTILDDKTNLILFYSHTATTNAHNISFDDLISTAHTHNISDVSNLQTSLNNKLDLSGGELTGNLTAVTYYGDGSKLSGIVAGIDISEYNSHTGDTSIHYTKDSINISDINSAHTHIINDISDLQNELDLKTDLSLFNSHTGATNPHLTQFNDLTSTGHTTHIISDIIDLDTSLDSKLNLTGGTLTGELIGTTIISNTLSATTFIGVDTTEVKNLSTLSGNTVTEVFNNATVSTDGVILYPTDMIAGVREEVIEGITVQVNKFWSGELFTKPKQFFVFDKDSPLATDDYNVFIPDTNITITKVYYKTKATTVNFNINHSSNVDIWNTDIQATTAVQFSDVINNPNCLAGLPVKYQASAIGATPSNIHITIYYTEG